MAVALPSPRPGPLADAPPARRLVVDGRFLLQDVTGVQRVALEFVAALDRLLADGALSGLAVELVVPARGELVTHPVLERVRVRRGGRFDGHLWEQLELPRLAGPDPLLCLGNVAPVARLLRGRAPVYTMVHDLSYVYFPRAYSRSFRLGYAAIMPTVLARSRRVFTVSESERAAIGRHRPRLDRDRLVAVQNGGGDGAAGATVSDDPAAAAAGAAAVPGRRSRGHGFLYVGSLTRRKNADGLVGAAVRLLRLDPEATFTVVGATSPSFGRATVEVPPDVAPRLRFLGQVNDPAVLEREYRRAAVFLFPSFYEASPLPPVEAMRFGCPVVAADIPSLRERCGDAARYCDPHSTASIVRQARALAGSARLWERQQRRGLRQAACFSWTAQVRTVLSEMGLSEMELGETELGETELGELGPAEIDRDAATPPPG